jgi:hypothetical protein
VGTTPKAGDEIRARYHQAAICRNFVGKRSMRHARLARGNEHESASRKAYGQEKRKTSATSKSGASSILLIIKEFLANEAK